MGNGNATMIHLLSRTRSTHIHTHHACMHSCILQAGIVVSQDIKYDLSFFCALHILFVDSKDVF